MGLALLVGMLSGIPSNERPLGMKTTIFLTGATGFLGTQIAGQFLKREDVELVVLVRAPDENAARERLRREWWDWPDLRAAIGVRIQVAAGDITLPNLGLSPDRYTGLVQQVTHIVHVAADIRLFAALDDLRKVNVTGTGHVLELARHIQADHGLARLGHVSTAYVAGKRHGPVSEVFRAPMNAANMKRKYLCARPALTCRSPFSARE